MAKLPRVTGKIFASNANANDIGQYGSALSGTKILTGDIATIQSLDAYTTGWRGAVISNKNFPTLQEMNGLQKTFSQQICYLLENGVPEWDENTTYYTNQFCRVNNELYYSLTDNNLANNPTNDNVNWFIYGSNKANLNLENSSPTANFATLLNNVGIRTVVETYSNGKSWYRKYSDGWVEQGGVITGLKDTEFTAVTLLVPVYEPTAGFMAQMTGGTVMSGFDVVAAIGYIPNNTTLMLAISDYGSFSDIAYWTVGGIMWGVLE